MLSISEVLLTRSSVSLAEFAELEGITVRSARARRLRGTLGVETTQSGDKGEVRVPVAEIRRLYGDLPSQAPFRFDAQPIEDAPGG